MKKIQKKHPWLSIHRNAKKTKLIISGWSILPSYFSTLFPHNNLIVLNSFVDKNDVREFANHCIIKQPGISHKTVRVNAFNAPVEDLVFDDVFIFSMGLQWVSKYWPSLLNKPCDCWSTALSYPKTDIEHLKSNLKLSMGSTLKKFYKSCCPSLSSWKWWSKTMLAHHIQYNKLDTLIDWLDDLASIECPVIYYQSLSFFADQQDPFGIKPNKSTAQNIVNHSLGHIISPKAMLNSTHAKC